MPDIPQSLGAKIRLAIAGKTEKIVNEEAKLASERVEKRVRDLTAAIACRCLEHFNMDYSGNRLTITVDFNGTEQK